ncbi:anti-sigma factor [Jeotgalibacillus haloalkalitolerans]|uniref:Regulator of SigK n=1 Tax=Jeotgalibacillus haloalkalitolerans TaxID=3104292 RepID=A0ABU5KRE6_9BACL|nr:anti-sigma factor [Jeotgalibacillus sp. HH7-29]MDZ5713668.1 anti-sigma factor [Jeotgalibacillus sp. HH7-29]
MTQQCDHVLDYYNQHLDDIEKAAFEKHLSECADCQEILADLKSLEDTLPYAADPVEPPAGMEERIFAKIETADRPEPVKPAPLRPSKKKRQWMLPSIAALLAISLFGNAYLFTQLSDEADIVQQATIDQVLQYAELAPTAGDASGTASIIEQGEEKRLVVQASNLAALSEEEVYQVWLLQDGQPERAGTFVIDNEGRGSVIFTLNEEYAERDWDTVAVSLEPDANSELPEGEIILASEI